VLNKKISCLKYKCLLKGQRTGLPTCPRDIYKEQDKKSEPSNMNEKFIALFLNASLLHLKFILYICGMKNNRIAGIDLDVLGTWASLICAIHCAVTPLVISYGLLGGMSLFENETWDVTLIIVSAILACVSLVSGYARSHRDLGPLIAALFGFAIIFMGHVGSHSLSSHMITASGGLLIAVAHIYNAALRKSIARQA